MFGSKELIKRAANAGLWLTLFVLLIVTSVHAITLVTGEAAIVRSPGLVGWVLYAARVAFPVIVEMCAVVVALGFAGRAWTGWQVWVGLAVESVWLAFAALNMLTVFAVEREAELAGWQMSWIAVGVPLSALFAGTLTYILKRVDPADLRALAHAAAGYFEEEMAFQVKNAIRVGPQAQKLIEQRAWLDYVDNLRLEGHTDEQIAFMLRFVPELSRDGDGNGRPDILDAGRRHPPAPPVNELAPFPVPHRPTRPGNGIQPSHFPMPQNQSAPHPPELD